VRRSRTNRSRKERGPKTLVHCGSRRTYLAAQAFGDYPRIEEQGQDTASNSVENWHPRGSEQEQAPHRQGKSDDGLDGGKNGRPLDLADS
jgi:hypothetical protein